MLWCFDAAKQPYLNFEATMILIVREKNRFQSGLLHRRSLLFLLLLLQWYLRNKFRPGEHLYFTNISTHQTCNKFTYQWLICKKFILQKWSYCTNTLPVPMVSDPMVVRISSR